MATQMPLQYKIRTWRQLVYCLSNTNRDLRIHVTDIFNNDLLSGFKISVDHPMLGTLFACVLEARGELIYEDEEYSPSELSVDSILNELKKYGFLVTFAQRLGLGGPQLEYLMAIRELGYDKIRLLGTWKMEHNVKTTDVKVVAFRSESLSEWIHNTYSASFDEFNDALLNGFALNLSGMSQARQYRWDWLKDCVDNIDDIIADNLSDGIISSDTPEPDTIDSDSQGGD